MDSTSHALWTGCWTRINRELLDRGYTQSTRKLYRQVLRDFAQTANCAPNQLTPQHITRHIASLVHRQIGADWTAQQISVLRVCFDRILHRGLLTHTRAPRKPRRLPTVLNCDEIRRLVGSAQDLRSYLILALLYGCGLKPGELRHLTWDMLQASRGRLCLPASAQSPARTLPLPCTLRTLLRKGKESGVQGRDYLFPGRLDGQPISRRCIENIVRQQSKAAGLIKPVTAMTLRHSYAVHQLENGMNVRQLQLALGHRCLHAALRYTACLPQSYTPPDPYKALGSLEPALPDPPVPVLFPLSAPRGGILSWLSGLQLPWRPRTTGPPDP